MSNTTPSETTPIWQKPAYLIGGAIVIVLLIIAIFAASGNFSGKEEPTPIPPTAAPEQPLAVTPSIQIVEPTQGAILDVSHPISVKGEGDGLFDADVVVQAIDAHGVVLAEQTTKLKMTREADATGGVWAVSLDIQNVMRGTKGKIVAFATDPKNGERIAETDIDVTFGEPVEAMLVILEPSNGAVLDIANPVEVKGEGQGLFEGSVVVHAIADNGDILAEVATTMKGDDVGTGGKGEWSVDLDLHDIPPGVTGRLVAFSTDPANGAHVAETQINVTFGEKDVSVPSALEGVLWAISTIGNKPPLEGSSLYIQFENGKLSGSAGCNTYQGDYQSDDKNLTIDNVVSTRKVCDEPKSVMEQESEFLERLNNSATYSTVDGKLTIFDADNQPVLVFTPAVAGTLTYKSRIALPDTAQVVVTLEDVTKPDVASILIGKVVMPAPPAPPIPFVVTYNLNDIDPSHTYAVKAVINNTADDSLLFTSTTSYHVITNGYPSYVENELSPP
jgi:uncharacterized lipoprotein YbaY